ncbi:MAG: hypothetical protein COU35_05100 [Candidatus Magasanikbacteria bacterium CG10_big_fil_rev_8_21_14_0_10_47_10]|uniref:Uncharacterized protein n=1 Tax=Candidatus Magasanikbacteria bacterium CG10_big_fil_rev_8_21_14_0_10_47_10 TaxID=1974652 RepID=A0A2H0TP53_9BACT|nr:MAG: hypothetical protein COU35_05100 [Candidatus Magasanikbacteria bacterium CG10_big_fil_rev_8_21_14_0_10_47_10]
MDDERRRDQWFWKSVAELKQLVEEAGLGDRLRHFNDVLIGHETPDGYGDPVLTDVTIDGRTCDVYHTDKKPTDTYHRIFIHIKE